MNTTTQLQTKNPAWGFFGTIDRGDRFNAQEAWNEASRQISTATADAAVADDEFWDEGIRGFLDSRLGRHFADAVHENARKFNQPLDVAISETLAEWQKHRISKATSAEHGIPAGLDQITGWVGHYAIEAEAGITDES
ncbi:MAG: hypothetical protein GYB50_04025 [Rhodobacteraceae bacterium]|nr:hypothetical protein [Paracoccaceae bacterium]